MEKLRLGTVTCDFLRLDEFIEILSQQLKSNGFYHVVTLNPEMVMLAEKDKMFRDTVNEADIRVPDGTGLIWAHWYLRSPFWSLLPSLVAFSFRQVERITGVDAVINIAEVCEKNGTKLYLLGGTPYQVTRTADKLRQQFPSLVVYTSIDHQYDEFGPADILSDINRQAPGVLLVAYGAPRQTIWIAKWHSALPSVRVAIGVGGAFAILSEDKARAPLFLRRLNLEWLWRLILEPSRYRRIWSATVQFPILVKHQKAETPPSFTSTE